MHDDSLLSVVFSSYICILNYYIYNIFVLRESYSGAVLVTEVIESEIIYVA